MTRGLAGKVIRPAIKYRFKYIDLTKVWKDKCLLTILKINTEL
jgi:hypothetical protein